MNEARPGDAWRRSREHATLEILQDPGSSPTIRTWKGIPLTLVFSLIGLYNDREGRRELPALVPESEELLREWREAMGSEAAKKWFPRPPAHHQHHTVSFL